MIVAYISGPYRSANINGITKNINAARVVAEKYWLKGYSVFCPHLNAAYFDGLIPDDSFLNGMLEILRRCDVIVMMSDWELSEGAKAELALAMELEKEIIFD